MVENLNKKYLRLQNRSHFIITVIFKRVFTGWCEISCFKSDLPLNSYKCYTILFYIL